MKHPYSGILVRFKKSTDSSEGCEGRTAKSVAPGADDTLTLSQNWDGDELHVNYWEIGAKLFLDIGVLITSESVESISIDLPWKLKRGHVFDLGSRLDGEKIITAIFNEIAHYESASDDDHARVRLDPKGPRERQFALLRLNASHFNCHSEIVLEGGYSTCLQIDVPKESTENKFGTRYVRIRVVDVPRDVYTSMFYQKDRNVLSSSSETRVFDFRINVRRGVPDDVLAGQPGFAFPKFAKIHLFTIVPRERELAFHSERFKACRSLEDEAIWNEYVQLPHGSRFWFDSVRNYFGYQWSVSARKDDSVKDLVALARFTSVKSSIPNIIRFLLLALVLGSSGSGIWAYAWCMTSPDSSGCAPADISNMRWLLLYRAAPAALVLILASPKNFVRVWDAGKNFAKWALGRIGYYLLDH